jgi:hypothetical protein
MVSLDVVTLYESVNKFILIYEYDTPPNPFYFGFKAVTLGTTLHSHLSLWQTETNRVPFNILTAMSFMYQDCKALSVFIHFLWLLVGSVNRLETGWLRNWDKRFFSPPQCLEQFWGPASWCFSWYWELLPGVKAALTWNWVLTSISCQQLAETGDSPSLSHMSLMY